MSNPSSGSRGYPPPPPPPRSSFLTHHLPPPVPSATSPHSYTSPGASGATGLGSGSHGDTSVWSSERDRPVSRSRWSPVLPTLSGERADRDRDRPGSAASSNARLPSFEYPHNNSSNRSSSHWDQHSPSSSYVSGLPNPPSVPQWATANRNTSSPYMRSRSPAKPPTPLSTNEYYHRPSSSHHIPQPYIPHNPLTSRQSYTVDASEDSGATHAGHDESPRQGYGGHSKHDLDVAPSPDDAARNGNSGQKKKKRRVALSCAECAKRKQKCNRETPCQHCVARRVPELCVPYTRVGSPPPRSNKKPDNSSNSNRLPQEVDQLATEHTPNHGRGSSVREASVATSAVAAAVAGGNAAEVANAAMAITAAGGSRPPSMLPTLSVRVSRIEALLNAVVNRVGGLEGKALSDWRINHAPATTPPPIDFALPKEEGEGYRPETSSTLSRPRTAGRDSVDVEGSGDEVAGLDMDSSIRNPLPQSMLRGVQAVPLGLDYHGTPAEQLQKLFKECGLSPDKVHELMRELPDEEYANRLIDWFFAKFNFVRYPIDEIVFRRSMDELYASPAVNARSVLSLPLIFIAFSIAIRIAPDEWNLSEEEKRVQSLKMYWNSKSAITIAQAVKAENVQLVETRILTGLYLILMHERRLAEGWAEFRHALTVGQAIGLHRDGLKLRLDPYSTEYRRLLWSYLIHADATYSCLLGRPTSIDMRFCDTRPPSNVDLADVIETRKIEPRPLSEPTFATYAILRRGLGEIVAKITQHFQRLEGETQYRDVEAIDSSLKTFVDNLPPTFTMLDPDRSYDEKLWYLPIHRYYIQTEILHFTIILHRPWLLRKLRSSRYNLSRNACFQAASTDFRIREAFKKDVPDFFETLLASSFREFNVAMIAGISIILDPRAPHAKDMRAILQNFTEQHPHDSSADDFSQKEAAIIATLYRRAKDLEEQRFSRPMSSSRIGGTLDNISSERTEPYPQPRRHSLTGGNSHNGVNMSGGVQSANHSPVKSFWSRNSPLMQQSGRGSIASIAGTSSPDEDQPQQLLDHWFMSNTSFGPPLSSLDPTQMVSMSGPVYNPSLLMGDSVMQDVPLNPSAPGWDAPLSSGEMLDANGVPVMNGQGMMPHPDQSLAPPGAMGVGYDVNGGMTGPVNGQMGQGGQWGDGNSVQYWNTLVDRIASGIGIDYGVGITS